MSYEYPDRYDIIVVGAGHAGCEASLAAARMGARVLVLTGSLDMVAQMSCNPAIGGVAKGHLVKEIDALGGEMASVIDETGIQYRRPRVVGVTTTMGVRYRARTVILTTGTFLRGAIFVGEARAAGGRAGEAPAIGLSHSLADLGFPLARLKTGTPCRLDRKTIDVAGLELQPGDDPPPMFRWTRTPSAPPLPQVP